MPRNSKKKSFRQLASCALPFVLGTAVFTACSACSVGADEAPQPAPPIAAPPAEQPAAQPQPVPTLPQTAPPPTQTTAEGEAVPQTVVTPSGKIMTLKFNDEFDAVTDKDGQPYIDRSKWSTTFWQGSSQRTL